MAAVSGHMASVGRVYISTDDLDRLRAERALCPALRAQQPLREQLKSCAACTMPADRTMLECTINLRDRPTDARFLIDGRTHTIALSAAAMGGSTAAPSRVV